MKYLCALMLCVLALSASAQQMRSPVEAKECSPGAWQSVSGTTGLVTCMGGVSTQSGTTYTLSAADCGTTLRLTSSSPVTLTLPASLAAGCALAVLQAGTGQVSLTAGSGATLVSRQSYTKTGGQWGLIGLTIDANVGGSAAHYVLTGDGAS